LLRAMVYILKIARNKSGIVCRYILDLPSILSSGNIETTKQ
jgi:hypothetical protein